MSRSTLRPSPSDSRWIGIIGLASTLYNNFLPFLSVLPLFVLVSILTSTSTVSRPAVSNSATDLSTSPTVTWAFFCPCPRFLSSHSPPSLASDPQRDWRSRRLPRRLGCRGAVCRPQRHSGDLIGRVVSVFRWLYYSTTPCERQGSRASFYSLRPSPGAPPRCVSFFLDNVRVTMS